MTVEERLRNLEDAMEIATLKARYCNAADGGWDRPSHNGDSVAALFIEDGVWDAGSAGRAEGQDAIRALFDGFSVIPFAFHFIGTPEIVVTGDEAIGHWHLIALLVHQDQGEILAVGTYIDRFVRTADGWRFAELKCSLASMNPREKGWIDHVHQAILAGKGRIYGRASDICGA